MSLGKDFGKAHGIMDKPIFEPDADLLAWKKKVASTVGLNSSAADEGHEKLYKTVSATIARQLYDKVLRQNQKSVMDEAQENGTIEY